MSKWVEYCKWSIWLVIECEFLVRDKNKNRTRSITTQTSWQRGGRRKRKDGGETGEKGPRRMFQGEGLTDACAGGRPFVLFAPSCLASKIKVQYQHVHVLHVPDCHDSVVASMWLLVAAVAAAVPFVRRTHTPKLLVDGWYRNCFGKFMSHSPRSPFDLLLADPSPWPARSLGWPSRAAPRSV